MPNHSTASTSHNLYRDGDKDAPENIKDNMGRVALDMCRDCGRAEAQLDGACPARLEPVTTLPGYAVTPELKEVARLGEAFHTAVDNGRLDVARNVSLALKLALDGMAVKTLEAHAKMVDPDPRPALERAAKQQCDILVHTIATAVQSGKSCPDVWADATREALDLALILRERDNYGRGPGAVQDLTKVIRNDYAVGGANKEPSRKPGVGPEKTGGE